MFTQESRHSLLQRVFWTTIGSRAVDRIIRYERMFDTVVRGYSLIGATNGEHWLTTLMDEAPTVVDVGFHDGASTGRILRTRPKAKVHAFDPSRYAYQSYLESFSSDDRVVFTQAALSNTAGRLPLHDYDNMCNSLAKRVELPDSQANIYDVPVTTVAEYCLKAGLSHVNFMKIDAEGYDLHVLEGGRTLLEGQGVDIFVFEFASGWAATKRYLWEAVEFIETLPYRLFHLYNGFLCPLRYRVTIDSCTTLPAMYVGISNDRLSRNDIELRNYDF